MLEFGSPSVGLAGSLLVAHPNLLDPNFRKGVLFISEDDSEEGTFGLTVNRPTERTVADVLGGQSLGALLRLPVFFGGPVEANQLIFAAFIWHPETERIECRHHLDLEQAQESIHAEYTTVRAFIGYAGWSKGQLEGELAQRAWLVGKPGRDLLDERRCKTLWRELLSGFGPWFRLLAEAPDDLSAS
ncbi:MAG: YqgE/AlgH family protein [Verrucomicrobiota bacterium]